MKKKFTRQHYLEDADTRKRMDKKIPRNKLSEFIRSATKKAVEEL